MNNDTTHESYTQLERRLATEGSMDVDEAVRHLKEDAHIRTFRETMARCLDMELADIRHLKETLTSLMMKSVPNAKYESIEKSVGNWLNGTNTISRDSVIKLAYALRMPVERAEVLLIQLCGKAFHWRDPEDIVWIFGLSNGMTYPEVAALSDRLREKALLPKKKKGKDKATVDAPLHKEPVDVMTTLVRPEVARLHTELELEAFLDQARDQLGGMHNTAYKLFMKYMDILQYPADYFPASMTREEIERINKKEKDPKEKKERIENSGIPVDKTMPVHDLLVNYMYRDYYNRAKQRGYLDTPKEKDKKSEPIGRTVIRALMGYWPEETKLSKMRNRTMDVTRTVLILLFLATDGGLTLDDEEEDDIDADEAFEDMEMRLNLMLSSCGFPQLDSRAPFDWMVLYCMYADESLFLEEHMSRFLESIIDKVAADDPTDE